MTERAEDGRRTYHLGRVAAIVIRDHLRNNPDSCLVVKGRIGAQPNIRYNGDEWQAATWAGAGELLTRTCEPSDVADLIQSGPRVEIEDVRSNDAFVEAFETGELELKEAGNA